MTKKTIELMPTTYDGRKSFYKKAYVRYGKAIVLESYGLPVARITTTGSFERLWDGYSATTMRHINSFVRQYADNIADSTERMGGKKWWISLPVVK